MDIFKLFGEIAIKNDNANKNIEEVTRLAGEASTKMSSGFANIGKAAVGMGKLIIGAGAAIGGALFAVTESTMDYRTAMGKLDTAFTTAGHSAEAAADTYNGLVRILGESDVAVEASNHLALLCDNEQELQTWTNICTGVFATFGDSLPIEGLTEAANETAKVGQVTGPLADALQWAGISQDAFNESLAACTTEQERQQLIMETLNSTYDEASQKYQEVNGDIIASNEATEKFNSAMATFGEAAQPIVNRIKDGFGNLLQKISELVQGVDFSKIESAIDSAFSWLIDTVVPAVKEFVGYVVSHKDQILAAISAVAAGFVAWNVVSIVQGVISAIKAWTIETEVMTVAQKLLNLAMNANPIGIIITVIMALVAAFIVLWNNCEGFRNFFIEMWEKIKVAFSAVVEWLGKACESIVQWFVNAWEWIKNAWASVGSFFLGIWDSICGVFAAVGQWFSDKFKAAKAAIENAWSTITEFFSGIWDSICGVFSDAVDVGKQIIDDIKQGISNAWEGLKSWFNNLWNGLFGNRNVNVNVNSSSSGGGGGVEQYAVGSILKGPTAFGYNTETGKTMIGGEAGYEAIAPIDVLQGYVAEAVESRTSGMLDVLERKCDELLSVMQAVAEGSYQTVRELKAGHVIQMNGRELGRAVRQYSK